MALHSIFDSYEPDTWSSDRERYESIFLERREHNRAGHKPRPVMPAVPAEPPVRVETPAAVEPPRPRKPADPVARNLGLSEMARRLTGKGRRA